MKFRNSDKEKGIFLPLFPSRPPKLDLSQHRPAQAINKNARWESIRAFAARQQ